MEEIKRTNSQEAMTIQHAIESAIKGGWKSSWKLDNKKVIEDALFVGNYYKIGSSDGGRDIRINVYEILLDPSFWQCLGKSEGWFDNCGDDCSTHGTEAHMVEFVRHISRNGSFESYFESL